jgi:hypothetical protein
MLSRAMRNFARMIELAETGARACARRMSVHASATPHAVGPNWHAEQDLWPLFGSHAYDPHAGRHTSANNMPARKSMHWHRSHTHCAQDVATHVHFSRAHWAFPCQNSLCTRSPKNSCLWLPNRVQISSYSAYIGPGVSFSSQQCGSPKCLHALPQHHTVSPSLEAVSGTSGAYRRVQTHCNDGRSTDIALAGCV